MLHASIPPPHVQPHLAQSSLGSPIQATGSISNATAQQPIASSMAGAAANSPPCSTLFVANLGAFVSEQELKDLFSVFPVRQFELSLSLTKSFRSRKKLSRTFHFSKVN